MKYNIKDIIISSKLISQGDIVVAGLSGGADSLCMIHILNQISKEKGFRLVAVHVNHKLREQDSENDEKAVSDFCKVNGIELIIREADVRAYSIENKMSLEEAGRDKRYIIFNEIADEIEADKIAVAHNKNDQAETVLMNIIRGCGLSGLKGMEEQNGRIIRPLLNVSRESILEYCTENGLSPVYDKTNEDTIYTRNRIRHILLPFLTDQFNEGIVDSIVRLSAIAGEESKQIKVLSDYVFKNLIFFDTNERLRIEAVEIKKHSAALQKLILRYAVGLISGNTKGFEKKHYDDFCRFIESGGSGKYICFPGGIVIGREFGNFIIEKRIEKPDVIKIETVIPLDGTSINDNSGGSLCAVVVRKDELTYNTRSDQKAMKQHFDFDKIKDRLVLRNRRNGDLITIKGGTKKLSDLFTDIKLPVSERDSIPLVARDGEIIWVIGLRVNEKYRVNKNTLNILVMEYS